MNGSGACMSKRCTGAGLQVGVAFTRFQTRFFQGKYGNLDASVVSYGPCQTPTLNFAVEQHQRIVGFVPEPFWAVGAACMRASGQRVTLEWARGRVFREDVGRLLLLRVRRAHASAEAVHAWGACMWGSSGARVQVQAAGAATVAAVSRDEGRKQRPQGLNTVALLKVASSALNIGPQRTMQVAESLYIQGYVSYPRTESSAYPANFDFTEPLQALCRQPFWGACARVRRTVLRWHVQCGSRKQHSRARAIVHAIGAGSDSV
jgi:DNA topoisomerase III